MIFKYSKQDIFTADFMKVLVDKFCGYRETFSLNGKKYQVTVSEVNEPEVGDKMEFIAVTDRKGFETGKIYTVESIDGHRLSAQFKEVPGTWINFDNFKKVSK